jgi:hypothetical protein
VFGLVRRGCCIWLLYGQPSLSLAEMRARSLVEGGRVAGGLVPVMALAEWAGLVGLVRERPGVELAGLGRQSA